MKYLPICLFTILPILFLGSCEDAPKSRQQEAVSSQKNVATIDRIPLSEILKMMQGTWHLDGKDQTLAISRRNYVLTSGDSILLEATVDAYANCPGFCSLGGDVSGISCFVVKGEFDATCYAIMKLTDSDLVCSLMGGNGEVLSFKRSY